MGRLGADASRVVDAARALARRHRHEAVEPVHLLGALVADARMQPLLTERAVDREDLVARVEARLVAWPASALYRDARAEPKASEQLGVLLDCAGARRIVSLLRPLTFEQLAREACALPSLASVMLEARSEIVTAKDAVAHARLLAIARGDARPNFYHLIYVLADQAWMRSALRDAGVDPQTLHAALERRLEMAAGAGGLGSALEKVGPRTTLLNAMLQTPLVAGLLSEIGVSVYGVRRALVRGSGESIDDESLPDDDGAQIDVVFHDDDFTTMEFVVDALTSCFDIPDPEATKLMLRVHRTGAEVVSALPAGEARKQIAKARAHARRSAMPLRITWRRSRAAEPNRDG
jgi:ATP-dependent Clp protease adaptor protein ClpS